MMMISPQMVNEGTVLEFKGWSKTQRRKCQESLSNNTSAFQKHKPMSYGYIIVKVAD